MDKTKIEWTDATWNPIDGCSPISEGCQNCYAANIAKRFWGDRKFSEIKVHAGRLKEPLKWKKPRRIFVCSMGDLWHTDVISESIDLVFTVVRDCPHHTFVFLTKRPERARFWKFPDNVWVGATVENQKRYEERLYYLLQVQAKVRFLSVEPMLSAVDFDGCLTKPIWGEPDEMNLKPLEIIPRNDLIHWVICGAETGPKARTMNPEWAINLYNQCKAASVPFFFKKESIVLYDILLFCGLPVPDYVKNTREFPE